MQWGKSEMRSFAWALVALLLGSLAGAHSARAQSDPSIYSVSGIEVDESAADAVTARQQAILQGQRDGLERLLRRIVPSSEYGRLPETSGLAMERFVQSFGIDEEQVSGTRYVAEMTVAYAPDAVRDLLERARLPFSQASSSPVLVLPVWEGAEGPVLWPEEGSNPWWDAWNEALDPERLLRLTLPLGDLQDITRVDAEQALAGDEATLLGLAARYRSEDVLVVSAAPAGSGEAPAVRLDASMYGELDRSGEAMMLQGRPGQSQEDLLRDAVPQLQDSLDEEWKRDHLLRLDQVGTMVVEVPFASLAEWVAIERRLDELEEISQVDVRAFARDQVTVRLEHLGEIASLKETLQQQGLLLVQGDETWQLRPTTGSPVTGGSPSARSVPSSTGPRPSSPTSSPSQGFSPSSPSSG